MPKFKTMDEVKQWVFENRKPIHEWDCPNFDMLNPTEEDLKQCDSGAYCSNRWGCHTFRHLRGSRDTGASK